ncbi:hypothetical protein E2C01_070638 [Portunus trituberculatus]|uniref:Uncharacterized protein n=1 Tax=Portunus trituberculatus TaxID=210409 RepID=A0A5B7HT85_PORTR|nr:hypothetical protein [Portunus trituberculatus]
MWWDSNLHVDVCPIPRSPPYPLCHRLPHGVPNTNTNPPLFFSRGYHDMGIHRNKYQDEIGLFQEDAVSFCNPSMQPMAANDTDP